MRQCWLRTNRRAITFGLLAPAALIVAGSLAVALLPVAGLAGAMRWGGGLLIGAGALVSVMLLYLMSVPRVAYESGALLVYLRSGQPFRIPVDVVECFFIGQSPSRIKDATGKEPETSTVVVRLAESAKEWHHRDVKPALGHWCDGYITIRGTWCEPLSGDLVQRMNHQLVDAHRQQRGHAAEVNAL